MIQRIHTIYIQVNNLEESRKFYEVLLECKVKKQEKTYIEFQEGFTLLEKQEGFGKVEPQDTHIVFEVKNLKNMSLRLKEQDVAFRLDITEDHLGKGAAVYDPNSHTIELFEPKEPFSL